MKKLFNALFTIVCSLSMVVAMQTNIIKATTKTIDIKQTTVTNVKAASVGTTSIRLTWTGTDGVDGYLIYRQDSKGKYGYRGMVRGAATSTYTDTTAETGEYNFYWIFPYKDINGKMETGIPAPYVYAKAVPASATNIKAVSVGTTSVKLTWNAVSNIDGYIIYRQIGNGKFEYRTIAKGTSFVDTTAKCGEYNYYRVYPYKVVNGKNVVGTSVEYKYSKPVPSSVSNLKLSKPNTNAAKLTWDKVSNVDGYIIYRQAPNETKMTYRYIVNTNSFTDSNLNVGGFYYYRVYAYKKVDGKQVVSSSTNYVYTKIPKKIIKYSEGSYQAGKDIPAGEYIAISNNEYSGYYCVSTDANGKQIVTNNSFKTFSYLTIADNQYITLNRADLYPASNAPDLNTDGEGQFKVGVDIPAGTYTITCTTDFMAYYAITNDANAKDIVSNDNFKGTRIVTVSNGQYLTVNRGKITKR